MSNQHDNRISKMVQTLKKVCVPVVGALKIAAGALATVLVILVICAFVFVGVLGDYLQNDIIPSAALDLSTFSLDLNSFVYYVDSNGEIKLLQRLYANDNREWAEYEDIPQNLINATVAIEDKRFYEHQGVDWITTIKACARMFFGDGSKGGSTITQQFIKNWTGEDSVTVQRKVLEIFRATEFEKRYDKELILEYYLNTIYMGNRRYGVKTAAEIYFGKELEQLTVAECASLISITNNPSLYNPYRTNLDNGGLNGADRNRVRMLNTLEEMLSQNLITQQEFDEAVNQKIEFKWGIDEQNRIVACGTEGCDFRDTVSKYTFKDNKYYCPKCNAETDIDVDASRVVYSYFVDTVLEDVAEDMAERDGVEWNNETKKAYKAIIQGGGYHIYTTLDMDVQEAVDKIYTNLDEIPKVKGGQQLQSAMVVLDNLTGDIVALAGGVGPEKEHDGLNRAVDSDLQTGSSIKPLSIYAPGFESGAISPATVIKDLPLRYNGEDGWPKNENKKYNYSYTIKSAVIDSINGVAANTLKAIGTNYSYKYAKEQFGLSGLVEKYIGPTTGITMSDIDYAPLAMGAQTIGITVRDMASAYGSFANNGVYREGRTYTKVYDTDGNIVMDNTQDTRQILSAKTVNYMNDCLGQAVTDGTGKSAAVSGQIVYGKTGTTSSKRDRWFCGYTKYYTAAVWCGFDQPAVINVSGNPAAKLFSKVMTPVHKGLKAASLVDTKVLNSVTVCLDSGKIATAACSADVRGISRTDTARVYKADIPKGNCDVHVLVDYCPDGHAAANAYCSLFAQAQGTTLEKKALVKMTQQDVEAIVKAGKTGLVQEHLREDMVYLITKDNKDGEFHGFNNDMNIGVKSPYIVCSHHTESAWNAYQQGQQSATETPGTTTVTGTTATTAPKQ